MSKCKNSCYDDDDDCEYCEIKPCHEVVRKHHDEKTLLEAISILPQTVAAGAAVPFDTNLVIEGRGIIHNAGSTDFNLVRPGTYRVTFTGSVTAAALVANADVALAINGSIIPGTTVTETVLVGTTAVLATQVIVQVSPFVSTVLTVVNPVPDIQKFTNPNVIIERIG